MAVLAAMGGIVAAMGAAGAAGAGAGASGIAGVTGAALAGVVTGAVVAFAKIIFVAIAAVTPFCDVACWLITVKLPLAET